MEKLIKQKLIERGFKEETLLNNRGLIGACIEETEQQLRLYGVVKSLPSKQAMTEEIKTQTDVGETKDDLAYKSIFADGFKQCYYWLRHESTK